jgi:hypothetical protein
MSNQRTSSKPSSLRPPRSPLSQRAKRVLLGIAIALAVSLAATGTILAASQQRSTPPPLTTKQQKENAYATQLAQAKLTPAATPGAPVPTPVSCPETTQDGISNDVVTATMSAGGVHVHLLNMGGGRYGLYNYTFFAGWNLANPQQGVIIVARYYYDSCSAQAQRPQNANYINPYLTPYQKGGIRMTAIQGPNILFTTLDGASGSFNFVTNQFS